MEFPGISYAPGDFFIDEYDLPEGKGEAAEKRSSRPLPGVQASVIGCLDDLIIVPQELRFS